MISTKLYQKYATDPAAFRNDLTVDVDGVARRFGDVMDDWQRADFAALDPALANCNGRKPDPGAVKRAYLERGRGHSKTTDLAVMAVWALAFATRPLRGYCFAADRDQAAILKDAMHTVVRLNPWLGSILSVESGRVVNIAGGHPGAGSRLEIFTSDVGSSYGILPDFIIADELVHWEGNGSLWHSLISSAAKRSSCLLVVISNAGFVDSWQWAVREAARTDPSWYFSRLDGPKASWMTQERLDEQRRMLPAMAYARLWDNQWSTGGGDALTAEDIAAAFIDGLCPMTAGSGDYEFVGGLDLGITRDASAVCVLGVRTNYEGHGRIRLAYTKVWRPSRGQKVNLQEVEDALIVLHERFGFTQLNYDPWQAEHMASRLQSAGLGHIVTGADRRASLPMVAVPATGKNLQAIASAVIEAFQDRRVELYDETDLRRDLHRLRVEEKPYGFRLVSPRDQLGHGDLGTAFGHAMLAAVERAKTPTFVLHDLLSGPIGILPGSRALRELRMHQEELEEEQRRLSRPDTEDHEWFEFMRAVGRR